MHLYTNANGIWFAVSHSEFWRNDVGRWLLFIIHYLHSCYIRSQNRSSSFEGGLEPEEGLGYILINTFPSSKHGSFYPSVAK